MSKSAMLRTRRRDVNVKPNRRLDRKSSRGMIYENEELRLRTININAEIERGQSDIKKLRKENEQLRKEIWCLRDEYDKLDRLLKEKNDCTSTSDSESCTSCSESEDPETTQNLENVQKTTLNSLREDFDHLSVVTEETSAENSDKNSQNSTVPLKDSNWEVLPPDMSYPLYETPKNLHLNGGRVFVPPKHFFSPLKPVQLTTFTCVPPIVPTTTPPINTYNNLVPLQKTAPDILIQSNPDESSTNSFANGGNLDELLQDIDNISQDILKISNGGFKSEISVVLMPKPMPLLGFDKYQGVKSSLESLKRSHESLLDACFTPLPEFPQRTPKNPQESENIWSNLNESAEPWKETPKLEEEPPKIPEPPETPKSSNPFFYGSFDQHKPLQQEPSVTSTNESCTPNPQDDKTKKTRKVSIYFKKKRDKLGRSLSLDTKLPPDSPIVLEPPTPKIDPKDSDNQKSSDSKTSYDKKHRKSSSTSPERKHVHIQDSSTKKNHKKRHRKSNLNRRMSSSIDKFKRDQRSFSVCTDRSNILEQHRLGFDEFLTNSERDRSNSLSSCETIKSRKVSQIQLPVTGKIPWFGCWGNGCL